MSWGEVKKINSDMTMPLDKLFWENKTLVASDTILQSNSGSSMDFRSITFKPKFDGAVRVLATAYAIYTGNHFIIKNLDTSEKIYESDLPYMEDVNFSVDISVKKGVTYRASCASSYGVKIGGMIIDVNPIEVVE